MDHLIEMMMNKPGFICLKAASESKITEAEQSLALSFSQDYKLYVKACGAAVFLGHELTGICDSPRLNVINATERARSDLPSISPNWYVLEEANMDGIVYWQDASGAVYQTGLNMQPFCIASSLLEFIDK